MKTKNYTPRPIDTSEVILAPEMLSLVEKMSENVHDTWALNRMGQGWTYGLVRDEKKKEHPCLIPYAELPEEEKDIDRDTARETLKFIISMGYKITLNDNMKI